MSFPPTRPDPTLRRILADLPLDAAVAGVEPVAGGARKETDLVRFDDAAPLVIQRAAAGAIEPEARLLEAIADRTTVPVPPVVGFGVVDGEGWLATRWVDGRDLHTVFADCAPATQRALARSFGRCLADLHAAFAFEGYGRLVVADGRLVVAAADRATGDVIPSSTSWPTYLRAFATARTDRLPPDFDDLAPRLHAVVAEPPEATPTPRLFPWDLRPGNALVADGALTAVLDFEAPRAAAAALSLAKLTYLVADWYVPVERARTLRAAVREGYASVRPPPTVRPVHRVAAVADAAVDSRGRVTNPRYPPVDRAAAVAFHRRAFRRALDDA